MSAADFARLRRDLATCADEMSVLKRELEINIQRMGAMQAEIDHLRAIINRT